MVYILCAFGKKLDRLSFNKFVENVPALTVLTDLPSACQHLRDCDKRRLGFSLWFSQFWLHVFQSSVIMCINI